MASPHRDEAGYQRFLAYIQETGLDEGLKSICLRHHVTLREIYLDVRGPTVYAARLEAWWWLYSGFNKSTSEIGRIFDRNYSSILHAFSKLKETAAEMGHELEKNGAHVTAKAVSKRLAETRVESGRQNKGRGKS